MGKPLLTDEMIERAKPGRSYLLVPRSLMRKKQKFSRRETGIWLWTASDFQGKEIGGRGASYPQELFQSESNLQ